LTDTNVLFLGKEEEMITNFNLNLVKQDNYTKLLMVFKTGSKLQSELPQMVHVEKQVYNYKSLYSNYLTVNNVTFIKSYIRTSLLCSDICNTISSIEIQIKTNKMKKTKQLALATFTNMLCI
jgi:hypothetical protein